MPKRKVQLRTNLNVRLTPGLNTSIKLLELSWADLLAQINEALETNVLLDEKEPATAYTPAAEKQTTDADQLQQQDSLIASVGQQLDRIHLTDEARQIAAIIAENLDHQGFLTCTTETLARIYLRQQQRDTSEQTCEQVRQQLIQQLEPTGIACFNTHEYMQLQLSQQQQSETTRLAAALLSEQTTLEQLNPDEQQTALERISRLSRTPAKQEHDSIAQIIADITIRHSESDWHITLTRLPGLAINQHYLSQRQQLAQHPHFNRHLQQARELINALEYRNNKLLRLTRQLLKVQSEAITKGLSYLQPCTQQQIAHQLDIHPSTLSRLIRDKYIDTPAGIIAIKNLFSARTGEHASVSIQQRIRQLIETETKPLSDQKITDLLNSEGIAIARRTVTKFRKRLNIPKASIRTYWRGSANKNSQAKTT